MLPQYALIISGLFSIAGYFLTSFLIREFIPIFLNRRLFGNDQCKRDPTKTPEPMGVISATVYLAILFIFTPVPFYGWLIVQSPDFPHYRFVEFLSGLLSICCMILLGFADDVLDLRWRHKLLLPSLASMPMLLVYAANLNSTTVAVPKPLQSILGLDVNLGLLYYVYMGMMAVFCTNAINILAGVNGLEAGQSVVICVSVVLFNIVQLFRGETQNWYHYLSLYFLLPYLTTTLALLRFNWYPARVFVGDTFCYFSGMTFAVVGILGHFSKSLLLFFVPQIVNFLYSVPQLFHILSCPRHRLPRYDRDSDLVSMSLALVKENQLNSVARLLLTVLGKLKLLHVRWHTGEDSSYVEFSNMTLLNLALYWCGPMPERKLVQTMLTIQTCCSLVAFAVRFLMASLVYDQVH